MVSKSDTPIITPHSASSHSMLHSREILRIQKQKKQPKKTKKHEKKGSILSFMYTGIYACIVRPLLCWIKKTKNIKKGKPPKKKTKKRTAFCPSYIHTNICIAILPCRTKKQLPPPPPPWPLRVDRVWGNATGPSPYSYESRGMGPCRRWRKSLASFTGGDTAKINRLNLFQLVVQSIVWQYVCRLPTSLSGPPFAELRREVGEPEQISSTLQQGCAAGLCSWFNVLGCLKP